MSHSNGHQDDRAVAIGSLEFSDSGLTYSRGGKHQTMRWDDIASVAYAKSPYGPLGGEDEWVVRGPTTLWIPDYPELTQPLLTAFASRLHGFDPEVLNLATAAGFFRSDE